MGNELLEDNLHPTHQLHRVKDLWLQMPQNSFRASPYRLEHDPHQFDKHPAPAECRNPKLPTSPQELMKISRMDNMNA
jgi:hypothetical protein